MIELRGTDWTMFIDPMGTREPGNWGHGNPVKPGNFSLEGEQRDMYIVCDAQGEKKKKKDFHFLFDLHTFVAARLFLPFVFRIQRQVEAIVALRLLLQLQTRGDLLFSSIKAPRDRRKH